jgi:hypothetical protein
MIMRAMEHSLPWEQIQEVLHNLLIVMGQFDVRAACELLREAVREYRPSGDVVDKVWCRRTGERRGASNVTNIDSRRAVVRREPTGSAD